MTAPKLYQPLKNRYMLMRHGQTDANIENIYMGRLDYELNEAGKKQASEAVLKIVPDIVIQSPLKRAVQTSLILLKNYSVKPIMDYRLIEKAGGLIDGVKYDEIAAKYPEVWGIWHSTSLSYILNSKFPGGESDNDVILRLKSLIDELENKHQNKNILLITHSGIVQAMRYLTHGSKEDIYLKPIPNCTIENYG